MSIPKDRQGQCRHPHTEVIKTVGGDPLGSRCTYCLRVWSLIKCAGCANKFQDDLYPRRRRRYCNKKCVDKAYRARKKKEREDEKARFEVAP